VQDEPYDYERVYCTFIAAYRHIRCLHCRHSDSSSA